MYLVTGATGIIGRRVVRLLREQEQPVRAFARLTSRYRDLEEQQAEIFVGDLRNHRDIERATQGVKYIISTHGSEEDTVGVDYRANIELIEQAKAKGVEHFVFISVLGADRDYEDAPVFKAKREVEKHLRASRLNYTILRPSGLASNLLGSARQVRDSGFYTLIGDPANRSSIVSNDDVAKIAVGAITAEGAKKQTFAVGGPDILRRGEIPQIFGRIFNKEPIVINIPLMLIDGIRSGVGFFNPELQKSLGTFRTLLGNEFYCASEEIAELESVFDMQMESLESFTRRYLEKEDS